MARENFRDSLERFLGRPLVRPFARFFRERLTPAGRGLVVLFFISAVLGNRDVGQVLIYRLWAFSAAALGMAVLLSFRPLPRLALRRIAVAPVSAGEVTEVVVEVENLSRRVAHDAELAELGLPAGLTPVPGGATIFPRIEPGEKVRGVVPMRTAKRGAYLLKGLAATSAAPLGLVRAERRAAEQRTMIVYPVFRRPEDFSIPEGRNYQPGGFLLSSNVGESPEFMHTREWRDGDNPRHVHWASTARLGKPVVKVYHEEYFVRLALIVDTEVRPGTSDRAFEWAVSTAAGIADHLSRREYIIDIFAAGQQVHHFQAGRAIAHFDHILELLACLDPAGRVDWEALSIKILPEAPRLTGVIAVLQDWSPERERFVAALESLGVSVRVIVVREGATTLVAPARPAESFVTLAPGEAFG